MAEQKEVAKQKISVKNTGKADNVLHDADGQPEGSRSRPGGRGRGCGAAGQDPAGGIKARQSSRGFGSRAREGRAIRGRGRDSGRARSHAHAWPRRKPS